MVHEEPISTIFRATCPSATKLCLSKKLHSSYFHNFPFSVKMALIITSNIQQFAFGLKASQRPILEKLQCGGILGI